MKKKLLALMLSLVLLFTMSGMAYAAPTDGYYVNGHRYDLTLSKSDLAYYDFLADMKAIGWDYSQAIIVNNNQYTDIQDAVDKGSIVLKNNAHQQVGSLIPGTVIPIANDGTRGASENVSNTVDDIIYASTNSLTNITVSVANGTSEAAAKAELDVTVGVVGAKGETGTATIAWTIAGYSAATAGDYTATGVLTLPVGWTGSAPNVTATVTVQAAIPPAYASTNVLTTTKVSVANGTSEAAAKAELDATVGVTGTKGETGTASIAWTIAAYSAATAGDYTATGVLTLPAGWTGSAANVTATVTVEAPAGPATAVEAINNAIANFAPVGGTGNFTGTVKSVKVVGDVTVNKCNMSAATTTINASKTQSNTLTVKITPMVQTSDKNVTVAAFPFAEVVSGSGVGAGLVSSGVLSEDANYYYIQLTSVDCPASLLSIITAAGNCNSSYAMNFTNQKITCKMKVSKTSGRVVSVDNITITGTTNVTKSTGNLANGSYSNTFNCTSITMTY